MFCFDANFRIIAGGYSGKENVRGTVKALENDISDVEP